MITLPSNGRSPYNRLRRRKLNVLLVAENCSRKMGGEAILAYHYFRLLKKRDCGVILLVHERNKEEVEELFPQFQQDIYFIEDTKMQKRYYILGQKIPRRIAEVTLFFLVFLSTNFRMKQKIRHLVVERNIDIVHQVIPVSPKTPSFIYDVGAPVIIGPMNGGMEFPKAFRGKVGAGERIVYSVGKSLGALANRIIPGKRKAAMLLVANRRTEQCLKESIGDIGNTCFLAENGVDLRLWNNKDAVAGANDIPFFIFIGRLVDLKGVDYLLAAFQRLLSRVTAELVIIGDGPETDTLTRRAEELEVAARVKFLGFVKQDRIPMILQESRALVFPSLCDCGGAVVLEAMAAGRAVIATDWGGPADYLDPSCGILVKPESEEAFVVGLADSMERLVRNPVEAARMGKSGRIKVEKEFDWEKKVDVIYNHYRIIQEANGHPNSSNEG